jgi:hypothetical protein
MLLLQTRLTPYRPKSLRSLRQSGTLPYIIIFVFALCERKNENNESGSTMLPQAKIDDLGTV